jgi:hypothetical protein
MSKLSNIVKPERFPTSYLQVKCFNVLIIYALAQQELPQF